VNRNWRAASVRPLPRTPGLHAGDFAAASL
jgi:hypothetical protein